ncbi:hypothetical protein E1B28_008518 [Marasmius oreades]|uniref:G domain-containing protein n=1 Tax=Marasmius oreades TaxID=181124 RepID=A0A9P7RYP9_9AGAR|nr:uncharacterized protein E1B28_008518 [Marasmius oreades]KAG7092145.1 hypothetical protein E1B28_008518 [Marasmius oreades]
MRRNTLNQAQVPTPAPATAKRRKATRTATSSSFTLPSMPAIPTLNTRPAIPSRPSTPSVSTLPLRPATPTLQPKTVVVEEPKVTIAVMGATGSGKTTFINHAGKLDLPVGHGIQSCTKTVQAATPFRFEGYQVTLIDTPGFDDDTITDVDVLKMVAAFLSDGYKNKKPLSGVIFLHRISDRRVGGVSRRNIKMFKELCGEDTLKNVVLATTMWEYVDKETGEARETELRSEEIFFKPVIDKGARLVRRQNTEVSAQNILRSLIGNKPLPLQIQTEMVDQKKDLLQTAAGGELRRDTEEQMRTDELEAREFMEKIKGAVSVCEQETREEVLKEQDQMQEDVRRAEEEALHQEEKYNLEKEELEMSLAQVQEAVVNDSEKQKREILTLQERLKTACNASAAERDKLQKQVVLANRQVQEKHPQQSTGYFTSYGASIDGFLGNRRGLWW